MMKVLSHSEVTDFGRCQKQSDTRQNGRRQIAGGPATVLSHAQTQAQMRRQCLCMCQLAEASQPKWVGMQGKRLAPPEASPARGPRRAAQARPRRGRRRRGPCSSRTARGHSACGRGRRVGSSWRGMVTAAPAVRCARRGLAGGEHGGCRRRHGMDCLTPRGEREALFGSTRACGVRCARQRASCMRCACSVHAVCMQRGAYLSSTPLCESTLG